MICSGAGAPRSASSISCCPRSRSRACCWWGPTAKPRWTRRIRWPRCCPGGASRPACGWLGLDNLAVPSLVTMVAEMLHVDRATAAGLVEVINERTSGNPYETVELLNALRREGVLTPTAAGWRWDDATARARLGQSEVAGLLAARVEAMPPTSRALVEAMACLGGRAEASLLQTVTAASAGVVDQQLAPALDEGVLVVEPGLREAVRFRHDRTREVILRWAGPAAATRAAAGHGAAAGRGAGVVRGGGRAVPAGDRRRHRCGGAPAGGGAAAPRRRPSQVDRGIRPGERAAGRRATADRPGGDRHADRGAHRPPRRLVQPGAPRRGGRGVPHDRAAVRHRSDAPTRRPCRCAA